MNVDEIILDDLYLMQKKAITRLGRILRRFHSIL